MDDGSRLYLLTINSQNEQLIDFYEIGTQTTQYMESKENMEIFEVYEASANRLEFDQYEVTRTTEIHYDFKDENKNDSIVLKTQKWNIQISESGTFSKL